MYGGGGRMPSPSPLPWAPMACMNDLPRGRRGRFVCAHSLRMPPPSPLPWARTAFENISPSGGRRLSVCAHGV